MADLVSTLGQKLKERGWTLASAESCTGGLIAATMTGVPGASDVFECGFVTYSNQSKERLLGVATDIIETHGAVSEPCAKAMVAGALANSKARIAVSVTGIAGPDGGSEEKPVGLVYIGYGLKGKEPHCAKHNFEGDRQFIRLQSVKAALEHIVTLLEENGGQ